MDTRFQHLIRKDQQPVIGSEISDKTAVTATRYMQGR